MIAAIVALLQADTTLLALLTGGVHRAQEISRQGTPSAFDTNKEIKPCALVKQETATPWGVHQDSGRLYVVLYFYERSGYTSIEAARVWVYAMLHRSQVTPVGGGGCYEIRHESDLLDQEDPSLGAAMVVSRYVATIQR